MNDGMEHIRNVMHVFIEGLAAGVYESIDDIQTDAREYLAMERAVEKLSKWDKDNTVEELADIFDGISNSKKQREFKEQEQREWDRVQEMPSVQEEEIETLIETRNNPYGYRRRINVK